MITKPSIIITSLGRTGTTFFPDFSNDYFTNITALHEPGRIGIAKGRFKEIASAIKFYGFKFAVIQKFTKNNLRSLSQKILENKISHNEAANQLLKLRQKFIESFNTDYYLESSYHYQGLLPIIPKIFSNYKIIYIVRDPRDWVRSAINFRWLYSVSDLHYLLGNRITPKSVNDQKYINKWKKFNQFQKLCWAWQYINKTAKNIIRQDDNARLIRFEDIFVSDQKVENFYELINYLADFPNIPLNLPNNLKEKIQLALAKKINQPKTYAFPQWTKWSNKQAKNLHCICGDLMKNLGYGNETEWRKKINS